MFLAIEENVIVGAIRVMVGLIVSVLILCSFGSGVAAADTPAGSPKPTPAERERVISDDLGSIVAANPGAKWVDSNTVTLLNGVTVKEVYDEVAADMAAENAVSMDTAALAPPGCTYLWLCNWDAQFYRLDFYQCGFVNFGASYGWSDRIRYVENNQTAGIRSTYYNWTLNQWFAVADITAYYYTGLVPGNSGIRISDGVRVC